MKKRDTAEAPRDAPGAPQADQEAVQPDLRRRVQDAIGDEAHSSFARRAGISPQTLKGFLDGGRIYRPAAAKLASSRWRRLLQRPIHPWGNRPPRLPAQLPYPHPAMAFTHCWIAESDGRVMGGLHATPAGLLTQGPPDLLIPEERKGSLAPFSRLRTPGAFHVLSVCVQDGCRGQGVGSSLMDYARAKGSELGLDLISLNVAEDNAGAVQLYQRLGYREVARERAIMPGVIDGDCPSHDAEGGLTSSPGLRAELRPAFLKPAGFGYLPLDLEVNSLVQREIGPGVYTQWI